MSSGAVTAVAFGVEATEVVDPEAEALVVAVASADAAADSASRSTTLPPAFLAPMAPPLRGITPIAKHETQLLKTYLNERNELYTKLTRAQLQLCMEGRALVRYGDYKPIV